MSKPYVESKFKELKILNRNLNCIQALDFQQCRDIYGQSKTDIKKKIYNQISKVAGRE